MRTERARPLAQVIPRRTASGLSFALPDREVEVVGDAQAAWDALALCDGRRKVSQIVDELALPTEEQREQVRALITSLLDAGALVDGTQAYRLLHRRANVGSPMFPEPDARAFETLGEERYAPPRKSGDAVRLDPAPSEVLAISERRQSARAGERRAVSFAEVSVVLAAAYGASGGGRSVPSAGALYPLMLHVAVRRDLAPLAPGIWWFDPEADTLIRVAAGVPSLEAVILDLEPACSLLGAGEPVIFISADLERPSRKYGNRGYRYALMESGAAMQGAYLAAAELELPLRVIGGLHDARAAKLLGLEFPRAPLLALLLGR